MLWSAFDGKESPKGISVPTKVAVAMVWFGEKVAGLSGKRSFLTMRELGDSLAERWFDCGRAKEVLGYVASVGIEEALREVAKEMRAVGKVGIGGVGTVE